MRHFVTTTLTLLAVVGAARGQTAGPPTVVALTGQSAPTAAGGASGQFTGSFLANVSASGQIVFRAAASGVGDGVFATRLGGSLSAVARVGDAAPTAGGTSSGSLTGFGRLTLNDSGRVALFADAGGVGGGLFTAAPGGALTAIARVGDAAPATAGGTNGQFASFSLGTTPALNASGRVAFDAGTTGTSAAGVFTAPLGGPVAAVARAGDVAPTTTPGPGYLYFQFLSDVRLNDSGRIAFSSDGSQGSLQGGVFTAPLGGAVAAVARDGNAAPTASGGNSGQLDSLGGVRMNAAGRVAFNADIYPNNQFGLFTAAAGGPVTTVVRSGQDAPTASGGVNGTFTRAISGVALNDSGRLVFSATTTVGSGIFSLQPGGLLSAVVRTGDAAPTAVGSPSVAFSELTYGLRVFAGNQIVFYGQLTGSGVTAANDLGLYASTTGGLIEIVREGQTIDVDPTAGQDLRVVADNGISWNIDTSLGDDQLFVYTLTFTDGTSGVFASYLVPVPEPVLSGGLAAAGLLAIYSGRRLPRARMWAISSG